MRHFDDRALNSLVAEELMETDLRRFGKHVRKCARCARRVEGWKDLFPQVERLLDPAYPSPVVALPGGPTLILPDREIEQQLRRRLRWTQGVTIILGAATIVLLLAHYSDAILDRVAKIEGLSLGLGNGSQVINASRSDSTPSAPASPVPALAPPESSSSVTASPDSLDIVALPSVDTIRANATTPPRADTGQLAMKPATAPRLADSTMAATTTDQAGREPTTAPTATQISSSTSRFRPVRLGEAIVRLGGRIREISGLERLSLEAGPGSLVPGARADLEVVRIRYRGRDSTVVTLVEQRLAPGQADANPNVTIGTSSDGQRMARWVDPAGLWLQLMTWGDQERVHEMADAMW
jgi:hypothetical protein